MSTFEDPDAVARYLEGPVARVPGLAALHRMTELLLAEAVPDDGHVLVLGAGGGLELKAFATARPSWRLLGVDPSAPMLRLAERTMGALSPRATLVEGTIDAAPAGPFDGATCLLTLHFLSPEQRLSTLRALWRRLRPGAPLVVAHHSFDSGEPEATRWLRRYAAFASPTGRVEPGDEASIAAIRERLPVIAPDDEVRLLAQAGFDRIELFYAGFTFRGWVALRP
ncbi:class I SAM-dependent methyltransferase [Luteimonas kalidii]|uniref:Class I SAM-dependent methyltransferase n=1 Tax=Luteimonas kalidii TaxID=3042025 RepID=A0ABT6JX12_9GAMM|nr:class I SAM-dependent methyltransferase [Luteimonas kalidii]MDH5835226.1 class I SAM-dependent methyltransferase [Luteimonas kalidii]